MYSLNQVDVYVLYYEKLELLELIPHDAKGQASAVNRGIYIAENVRVISIFNKFIGGIFK